MANIKTTMLELRILLRLLDQKMSERGISKKMKLSRSSIRVYRSRAEESGKSYSELLLLDDAYLSSLLKKEDFHKSTDKRYDELQPLVPNYVREIQHKSNNYTTYELLWEEYRKLYPQGYGYTRFKALLQEYEKSHHYAYHNSYVPGGEMQIDFAGDKLYITDRKSNQKTSVDILCCILPYSSMGFVIALHNSTLEHFYYGISKALEYFRGVPQIAKSDNMRQWVKRSDRYEPSFNEAAIQWGLHYGTELVAARVFHPKDKAPVEGLVYKTYQYIYARVRNDTFFSLDELNSRIFELTDGFNNKSMQGHTYSRMERFEKEEYPLMKQLPTEPYVFKYSKEFTVNSTYHVSVGVERHFYSIPYQYVNKKAIVVYDYRTIEIYIDHNRVAIHKRYFTSGYSTESTHMPEQHLAYRRSKEYNADYFIRMGSMIGEHTITVIRSILTSKPFVQQAYRSCQGILSLSRKYSNERIEAACGRVCDTSSVNYTMIKRILQTGLDKEPIERNTDAEYVPQNENVRGPESYQ